MCSVVLGVCHIFLIIMEECFLITTLSFSFSLCRDTELGDVAVVGQCRPLSKTIRFNVLKIQKAKGGKKQFQKF